MASCTVILALGYGVAVMVLVRFRDGRALSVRTHWTNGLYNYVMQSLIFASSSSATASPVAGWRRAGAGARHAVYAAQMLLSARWLGRFRYGPLEWLWRTLMYGRA
jgi:uncharacterized protein